MNIIPKPIDRFLDRTLIAFLEDAGRLFILLWESAYFIFTGRIEWVKTLTQAASIGFDSLPMTVLICLISGSVLALQTADKFAMTGADDYVGGLVALAVVREMVPIFACLTVGARSGTAIAAELAFMKVDEQVDALQVMKVSPIRYLVVPRILASIIALPMLTLVGEVIAVLGGMVVAQGVTKLHYYKYMESVWLFLERRDVLVSVYKAAIFGLIMSAICCTVGLLTKGGARDVGLATTKAVVWTAVCIIIADFILSWIFFGASYSE
ncbi:MAG: ABC transporter permease [Vampirovibrionales bacterium]|nr:ABC transporter permease [Vampirovibrionales bacterium]